MKGVRYIGSRGFPGGTVSSQPTLGRPKGPLEEARERMARAAEKPAEEGITTSGLPKDIQLGNDLQNSALDRVEQSRRNGLSSLSGLAAQQGQAAKADYRTLADRVFAAPGNVAGRATGLSAQMTGGLAPTGEGSPLDQRLAAVAYRQLDAQAQKGARDVAVQEEAAAMQRLLSQIGNNADDRNRVFTNTSGLNTAKQADTAYNAQGQIALGELIRQAGMGRRQADITNAAGDADRARMIQEEGRRQEIYNLQRQLQQERQMAQSAYDSQILGQVDAFMKSLGMGG